MTVCVPRDGLCHGDMTVPIAEGGFHHERIAGTVCSPYGSPFIVSAIWPAAVTPYKTISVVTCGIRHESRHKNDNNYNYFGTRGTFEPSYVSFLILYPAAPIQRRTISTEREV